MRGANASSIAERLLGKAELKLGAARELYDKGFFEDSASRSYYAMFHAARAALARVGVTTKTHEGTVSEFGRVLVLGGVSTNSSTRSSRFSGLTFRSWLFVVRIG